MFRKAFGFFFGALMGITAFFILFTAVLVGIGILTEINGDKKAEDAAYEREVEKRREELCRHYGDCNR